MDFVGYSKRSAAMSFVRVSAVFKAKPRSRTASHTRSTSLLRRSVSLHACCSLGHSVWIAGGTAGTGTCRLSSTVRRMPE